MYTTQDTSTAQFRLGCFVPEVVKSFIRDNDDADLNAPLRQCVEGAVMFADVSGFTKISESLAQKGAQGAEDLGFYLNRYMENLVKAMNRSGGDVFKFAGDAVLVLWTHGDRVKDAAGKDCEALVARATQCALDIQEEFGDCTLAEGVRLKVKIGIGVGEVFVLHVGGHFGRLEYLSTGNPLMQAFQAENNAHSGDVILSPQAHTMVKGMFKCTSVKECFKVLKLKRSDMQLRNVSLRHTKVEGSEVVNFETCLRRYIPAAILPHLFGDANKLWWGELRQISIVFCNLGINAKKLENMDEVVLAEIQEIVVAVQSAVYNMEGSLNKFLIDDKGSTILALFGLPPLAHENDPIRAILSCLKMLEKTKALGLRPQIGVTSGMALCGTLGSSSSRREYTVLGDVVNLAARLMQNAEKGTCLCDRDTYAAASSDPRLRFTTLPAIRVKGKSYPIPIFQPSYVTHEPELFLPPACAYTVARGEIIQSLSNSALDVERTGRGRVELVTGDVGMGKTHLFRDCSLEFAESMNVKFYWGVADCFSSGQHFAWRQILRPLTREACATALGARGGCDALEVDHQPAHKRIPSWNIATDEVLQQREIKSLNVLRSSDTFDSQPTSPNKTPKVQLLSNSDEHGFTQGQYEQFLTDSVRSSDETLVPHMHLLNSLLGVSFPRPTSEDYDGDESAVAEEENDTLRERIVACLLQQAPKSMGNIVLIMDQSHWAHRSDWRMAKAIAERIRSSDEQIACKGLSLWIGTRPLERKYNQPRYRKVPMEYFDVKDNHCDRITELCPWTMTNTLELLAQKYRVATVDPTITSLVHSRCGGSPLVAVKLAELLHHVLKAVIIENDHAFFDESELVEPLDTHMPIPYRVQRVAAAHFDRMSCREIEVLKVAAVLCVGSGKSCFSADLVADCLPTHDNRPFVVEDLENLVENHFLVDMDQIGTHTYDNADEGRSGDVDNDNHNDGECMPSTNRLKSKTSFYISATEVGKRSPHDRIFAWKYGLLRDVVYQLMLFRQRHRMHLQCAYIIGSQLEDILSRDSYDIDVHGPPHDLFKTTFVNSKTKERHLELAERMSRGNPRIAKRGSSMMSFHSSTYLPYNENDGVTGVMSMRFKHMDDVQEEDDYLSDNGEESSGIRGCFARMFKSCMGKKPWVNTVDDNDSKRVRRRSRKTAKVNPFIGSGLTSNVTTVSTDPLNTDRSSQKSSTKSTMSTGTHMRCHRQSIVFNTEQEKKESASQCGFWGPLRPLPVVIDNQPTTIPASTFIELPDGATSIIANPHIESVNGARKWDRNQVRTRQPQSRWQQAKPNKDVSDAC